MGTGYVAHYKRKYRSFEEARQFVHSLGLKNRDDWIDFCEGGSKPVDIPNKPNHVYDKEWNSWVDSLGYEDTKWSVNRVKELLRSLIDNKIIYDWSAISLPLILFLLLTFIFLFIFIFSSHSLGTDPNLRPWNYRIKPNSFIIHSSMCIRKIPPL